MLSPQIHKSQFCCVKLFWFSYEFVVLQCLSPVHLDKSWLYLSCHRRLCCINSCWTLPYVRSAKKRKQYSLLGLQQLRAAGHRRHDRAVDPNVNNGWWRCLIRSRRIVLNMNCIIHIVSILHLPSKISVLYENLKAVDYISTCIPNCYRCFANQHFCWRVPHVCSS